MEPGKDIGVPITGLKQGEKLNEELADDPGDCDDSEHPSSMILRAGEARSVNTAQVTGNPITT